MLNLNLKTCFQKPIINCFSGVPIRLNRNTGKNFYYFLLSVIELPRPELKVLEKKIIFSSKRESLFRKSQDSVTITSSEIKCVWHVNLTFLLCPIMEESRKPALYVAKQAWG
jgi:hypothetical protein